MDCVIFASLSFSLSLQWDRALSLISNLFIFCLAHEGAIRGVIVDGLNQIVITGASDSKLKFWNFKLKKLLGHLTLNAAVNQMLLHRERLDSKLLCSLLLAQWFLSLPFTSMEPGSNPTLD